MFNWIKNKIKNNTDVNSLHYLLKNKKISQEEYIKKMQTMILIRNMSEDLQSVFVKLNVNVIDCNRNTFNSCDIKELLVLHCELQKLKMQIDNIQLQVRAANKKTNKDVQKFASRYAMINITSDVTWTQNINEANIITLPNINCTKDKILMHIRMFINDILLTSKSIAIQYADWILCGAIIE